jgi:serine/threonine-protein kinase
MASPEFKFVSRGGFATARAPSTSRDSQAESEGSTQPIEYDLQICPPLPDPPVWGHLTGLQRISRGCFGTVYRAWDTLLQREVALKLYGYGGRRAEGWYQFGLREARLLARIRHPNVVTVYGVDHREGRLGIWMEHIRGRTLDGLVRDCGALDGDEAAGIGADVCSAVAASHALGLLHCDVSAKNVMQEEDGGRIVLVDFGLGQDLRRTPAEPMARVCGTPLYMAPELFRGEPSTVRSDIYSIGVLMYRLVTGGYPVEAGNFRDIRAAHESGAVARLAERRPDLSRRFLRIVERALAREPGGRFCSAGEMADALRGV